MDQADLADQPGRGFHCFRATLVDLVVQYLLAGRVPLALPSAPSLPVVLSRRVIPPVPVAHVLRLCQVLLGCQLHHELRRDRIHRGHLVYHEYQCLPVCCNQIGNCLLHRLFMPSLFPTKYERWYNDCQS